MEVNRKEIMGKLAFEIERNIARGDKEIPAFTGHVRSLENLGLEKGDTFTIPTEFKIYEQKINGNSAQYIMVELENGNAKPFYPSTFTKSRTVYNEDGTATTHRMHVEGSAAELFRQYTDPNKGMEALKGKKLTISDVKVCRTLRFGTQSLMNAQLPVIDIVK